MVRRIAAATAAALGLSSAPVVAQEFPQTQTEFYEAGQTFANCAAYFKYGADVAHRQNLTESARALEGMERGWSLAGMFLLVDGLDVTRQTEVQTLFTTMRDIKVDQIKANREMSDARGATDFSVTLTEGFQTECAPWSDMQKSIIQAMRSTRAD